MHPFRFGAMVGRAASRREWLDQVRTAEDLGYSTVFISDHFSDKLAPLPALAMAAENTSLNIGTLVLANDFRHPAVLAKEAATVDLLSEGRLELGIGTGWDEVDYAASGIRKDPPRIQVDRFEEAVVVLRESWSEGPVDFDGEHYRIHHEGLPKPGEDRPTLLIGGGGRRMLGIAARYADIVGISAGEITNRTELRARLVRAGEVMDAKIGRVREVAAERFEGLEINILTFGLEVGDRRHGAEKLARAWDTEPEAILASPHFLVGSPEEIAAVLVERRERWGINYPVIQQQSLEAFAPVIELLSGS
ncbi:MAG TPA: TIGR03621 family F420-dependent LLM class oxidoreductase [Acidimicrobiia bacterium]|nr:TIGR03621 family F420-dependent LLM class oxidoreductase [Acidimicrobiia bacterium]